MSWQSELGELAVGQHYLNGVWQAGTGEKIAVVNPANGTEVGYIRQITDTELETAVTAAQAAFRTWSVSQDLLRADLLHASALLMRQRTDRLAMTMTAEQGKPLNEAKGEIIKLAQIFDFYAEEATRIHGEIIPNDNPMWLSQVTFEPVGVVAAITPWNYPAELIGWKLAAALAAGCTIILKPASLAPLVANGIFSCLHDAGVPAGVANLVNGTGQQGARLAAHPKIAKIAFTGSSVVGLDIQRNLTNIKHLGLELGGNCPMVITAKCDLDLAVAGAVRRAFRNMGQICISVNRIYVAQDIYEDFIAQLVEATTKLVIDDGLANPTADLGPMASAAGLAKVEEHVADARAQGARILCGGERLTGTKYAQGHFYRPTVIADAKPTMQVMCEESFGPIVGVASYTDPAQAIAWANDTNYGLAAYCYTNDLAQMRYFSRHLEYGSVAINNVDAGIINAPYGGRKQSGIGYEHGRAGLLEYLVHKHVRINFGLEGNMN